MTNQQFLQQFGHFIEAPNGIQKLRELILQLAVQGKLVAQDPREEPASTLLAKIELIKKKLIEEGELRKGKPISKINIDEHPFAVPKGWEWVRFGDATICRDGERVPLSREMRNNRKGPYDYYGASGVIDRIDDYLFNKPLLLIGEDGANLINRSTPIAFIAKGKYWVNNHAHVLDGISEQYLNYVCLYINAIDLKPYVTGTAQPKMNQAKMNSILVAMPPEQEQHRIVAKVDELMSLCDQMEAERNAREATHQRLIRTVHHPLTETNDTTTGIDSLTAWHRIRDNFADLYTTLESVQALRQTILQLAVQGKLVEQDPKEEPAKALMERILTRKKQLISDKIIKNSKELPPVSNDEKLFPTPKNWVHVRFSVFADEIATGPFGSMVHKSDYITGGAPLINPSHMIDGVIVPDDTISVSKEKAKDLESYKLYVNDIVMARRGEMGRCALVTDVEEGWLCGTGSFVLRFHRDINRRFILLLFSSEFVRTYLGGNSVGTTMTNLNHGILNKMPVAVPPVDEQDRIVAKVDELMALCDQLEADIRAKSDTATRYAETIVQQIAAA